MQLIETDVLSRWKEHFDALLNGEQTPGQDISFLVDDSRPVAEPTTQREVSDAINSLKNNKAPGPDDIPAELLKHGGEELVRILLR